MKNLLVILDNGHGTRAFTKGKRSPDERIFEGEWNRMFVERLNERLKNEGFSTFILVPEEKDVSLSNRVLRANTVARNFKNISPDWESVLISIHLDAAPTNTWSDARGLTVHVSENASKKSKLLAQLIQTLAKEDGLTRNRWLPKEMYFTNNYYICKNTSMPAILVENGFMTNSLDIDFLLSEEGIEKLINLYIDALKSYSIWLNAN